MRVSSYCALVMVSSAWVTVIRPAGGHCVDIMSHYYCRVESSSESAARGYGISEYSKNFRRGLDIAILHTFLGKTELFHYSYYFEDHHL